MPSKKLQGSSYLAGCKFAVGCKTLKNLEEQLLKSCNVVTARKAAKEQLSEKLQGSKELRGNSCSCDVSFL
jgi:hypothetical protein